MLVGSLLVFICLCLQVIVVSLIAMYVLAPLLPIAYRWYTGAAALKLQAAVNTLGANNDAAFAAQVPRK